MEGNLYSENGFDLYTGCLYEYTEDTYDYDYDYNYDDGYTYDNSSISANATNSY